MFCEEDQENLYNLVQDKATAGKQGLGIKDIPKKIAGARFKGKKTSLGSSDEDEEEEEDNSIIEKPSMKRKHDGAIATTESEITLKSLCKRLLRKMNMPQRFFRSFLQDKMLLLT